MSKKFKRIKLVVVGLFALVVVKNIVIEPAKIVSAADTYIDKKIGHSEKDNATLFSSELDSNEKSIESKARTVSSENNRVVVDVILNEGYTVEQFEEIINEYYPEIAMSSTPEIQLIHLMLPTDMGVDSFLGDEKVQPYIYIKGELPDISVPQNPLGSVELSKTNFSDYNQARMRMTEEELFDTMAWHVDEVTNDRISLDISTGEGAKVGIIDSGVDAEHPILSGKINTSISRSYVEGESCLQDNNGHGTGVAGIVAQIAPEAEMIVYKVIGANTGDSAWTIEAIIQAAKDQCNVVNMSLGTYKCEDVESELLTIEAFERAIEYAETQECVVVASAGNKALDLDQYYQTEHIIHLPGGIESAVTVSSKHKTSLASYSNFGSDIDLCASGGDLTYTEEGMLDLSQWIYCLYPTNMDNGLEALGVPQGYSFNCGTSLAAPIVSASYADVWSYYLKNEREVSMEYVLKDIINGVDDLGLAGEDTYLGVGAVNLYKSLSNLD